MKKITMKKSVKWCLFGIALIAVALLLDLIFGGGTSSTVIAFAAIGAVADSKGMNTDLTGTVANDSQAREGGLIQDEIDQTIANFRPYIHSLDYDIRTHAKKMPVNGYEIIHYSSASPRIDCETNAAITNETAKNEEVILPVGNTDSQMFNENSLVSVDVDGYDEDGNSSNNLILYVVSKINKVITVKALNGKKNNNTTYVPDIPAGTKLSVLSNACSETQLHVAPENYQPVPFTVYLQKKVLNIVISDLLANNKNLKISHAEQELINNALYNFKRKNERNMFVGTKSKFKIDAGNKMGTELCYTSQGIIPQLVNLYGYDGVAFTYDDLMILSKMQFTKNGSNNEAMVYCGKNALHKICNIDFTKHKDVEFASKKLEIGIDIKSFKSPFGTLEFKYSPVLDDLGYDDFMVILDMKNAVRYVKTEQKAMKIDMKEGAGDNREASRSVYIEIDALCLKGHNSILVGPNDKIVGRKGASGNLSLITVDDLNDIAAPKSGQVVYVTSTGIFWKYTGSEWSKDIQKVA